MFSEKKAQPVEQPKSQRYLENQEQQVDVRVTANMQRQVGKKVSEIINSKIKFVDIKPKHDPAILEIEGGVKLFNDSNDFLTPDLPEEIFLTKEQRKKIKKRTINEVADSEIVCSKEEKISKTVVTSDQVLSGSDMEHWSSRRKGKVFKYKKTKGDRVCMSLDKE